MDYARAVQLAARLILKNGRQTTLQRLSATASNPAQPWKGPGSPTVAETFQTAAVFLPHTGEVDLGKYLVDDELLKRCEQVALIAGGSVDLTTFTRFLDGSQIWKIEWVRELKPADITVLYAFGVNR